MKRNEVKKRSMTYFDGVLILVALFLVSVWILVGTQTGKGAEASVIPTVEVRLTAQEPFSHLIPRQGDSLYNEKGEKIGEVLSVKKENEEDVVVVCRADCQLQVGDSFVVETKEMMRTGTVKSVWKEQGGQ